MMKMILGVVLFAALTSGATAGVQEDVMAHGITDQMVEYKYAAGSDVPVSIRVRNEGCVEHGGSLNDGTCMMPDGGFIQVSEDAGMLVVTGRLSRQVQELEFSDWSHRQIQSVDWVGLDVVVVKAK